MTDLERFRSKLPKVVSVGRDRNPRLLWGISRASMARLLEVSDYIYNRWESEPETQPEDIEKRVLMVFIGYDMYNSWRK